MYKFHAFGHPNILATHKTTLEFTKDEELSLKGDCIIGVKADFDLKSIKKFIKSLKSNNIKIIIKAGKHKEEINGKINPGFNSDKELVMRKSDFVSERTFALKADKAAFDLKRQLASHLKEEKNKIDIKCIFHLT